MARAKRHYIPGQVWHITHRCHKRDFLLKFAQDRRQWLQWLYESKMRYGLMILNDTVTSNHIHLLVADDAGRYTIPDSIKLIDGRTGQEFNHKKKMGLAAKWRKQLDDGDSFQLRERSMPYGDDFGVENSDIGSQNAYSWD